MPNNDSHQHVVKTTEQWNDRAIENWVVPRGCLCVELTPEHKTKIKIGEGNKFYHQLPYISESDLSNYYTKTEVDNIINNLHCMAIKSVDEYDSVNDLPTTGNKLGDVRFVKSTNTEIKPDPDTYVWNGSKWLMVSTPIQDIDPNDYVTKEEFNPIKNKLDEIYPKAHTHANKDILDGITQADRDKFDDLHNYDDTEIRELIAETTHTHPNKSILDSITYQSILSTADREKFDSLHNYDDSNIKTRVTFLESQSHTHSNKSVLDRITQETLDNMDALAASYVIIKHDIEELKANEHTHPNKGVLDSTTAAYTIEQRDELTRLSNIGPFIGAGPTWDGYLGYVPAPEMGQQTYFLRADGTWAKVKSGGDKYKAGEGIYILSGETTSDTFPFNIYSQGSRVKQYIIYGNVGGVGELVNGEYHIPVIVSAPGHANRTSTIILSEPMYDGDYIDFERQVFAHYRTDITSQIHHPDTDTRETGISSTGELYWKSSYRGWGGSPRVTDYIEIDPTANYEISIIHPDNDFTDSLNVNLYDENKVRTRTIVTSKTNPTAFSPTAGEKYMRQSYTGDSDGYCHVFQLKPVETPCILQEVLLYPNAINTIDIDTTVKPAEVYFEVEIPDDPDPDDPMSQYSGIIYNDGVLDVEQEDPTNLGELTFHYRDNVDKVITIPSASEMTGATASTDGTAGIVPAPLAGDEGKFLRGDGTWAPAQGGGTQYVRVNTTDSFLLLHTEPADWEENWSNYFALQYDELTAAPPDWDPTKHYKYENDNYVLGTAGDTFVSTTWYDKHYVGLDPSTPVVFDSDVYYTGDLHLIEDGETFDTAFEKVNEAIEHIGQLEQEVQFLKDDKIGVRTTSTPEQIEFYNRK